MSFKSGDNIYKFTLQDSLGEILEKFGGQKIIPQIK